MLKRSAKQTYTLENLKVSSITGIEKLVPKLIERYYAPHIDSSLIS